MNKKVTIELEDNDWGQILDGLTCRAEQYELTAEYYEGGYVDDEVFIVRDAEEARNLAEWCRRLIEQIRKQLRDE
jgi:hypothetical protein